MAKGRHKRSRAQRTSKAKDRRGTKFAHPPAGAIAKPHMTMETSPLALAGAGAGWPIAAPPAGRGKRERITIRLAADLFSRAKNAVKSTPGLTLAGLAVEALQKHLNDLERQRNGPVPSREGAPKSDESEK